jgi:hypothetical protein
MSARRYRSREAGPVAEALGKVLTARAAARTIYVLAQPPNTQPSGVLTATAAPHLSL